MFHSGQPVTLFYGDKSAKSTLRGWKMHNNEYLLVDSPSMNESRILTARDLEITVRLEKEGTVYSFVTKSAILLANTNLLLLRLKEEMKEQSMRSATRYQCFIPVDITSSYVDKEKPEEKGMICDISTNGVKLLAENPIKNEEFIKLTISLGSDLTIKNCKLKIVRSKMVLNKYMYGALFQEMDEKDKDKLENFFNFFKKWKLQE